MGHGETPELELGGQNECGLPEMTGSLSKHATNDRDEVASSPNESLGQSTKNPGHPCRLIVAAGPVNATPRDFKQFVV